MDAFRGSEGSGHQGRVSRGSENEGGRQGKRSQRVLVVDDNAQAAQSLATIIKLWGHDTRVAYDGGQALDSAREYQPDVVMLDISLPGMDGYAVARVLRGDPSFRNARLWAVTGYGRDQDRLDAMAAGFDRHLVKPLELDVLEYLLASLAETPR